MAAPFRSEIDDFPLWAVEKHSQSGVTSIESTIKNYPKQRAYDSYGMVKRVLGFA